MPTSQIPFDVEVHRGRRISHTQLGEGGSPADGQENSSNHACTPGLLSLGMRERRISGGPPAVSQRQDNPLCSAASGEGSFWHNGSSRQAAIHACNPGVSMKNTVQVIKGPYTAAVNGCVWNCRSMWSKRTSNTFNFVLKLAQMHDFCIFTETRETKTRRQYTLDSLSNEFVYFSSGISARKGGVAIIVKRSFLEGFQTHKWVVASCGRVAKLELDGKNGKLNIVAVYLDPASVQAQVQDICRIKSLLDSSAHNLVAGDWNFVEHSTDRIAKSTANVATSYEKRPAVEWQKVAQESGLQEFEQANYTCENSHGWSRIDRIYTDMHKADLINSLSYCTTLEHPRNLSDHNPVSFGYKKRAKKSGSYVPAWVASHTNFEAEVEMAMERLTHRFAQENQDAHLTPAEGLVLLKLAIREAATNIRSAEAHKLASTTAHKLAITLSFIRSIEAGDCVKARSLQRKYDELRCLVSAETKTSKDYLGIKNLAVNLMHIDIDERIRELSACRNNMAEDIYDRRKKCIAARLKQLLPAGPKAEILIVKDGQGAYHTEAASIAAVLTGHWQTVFDQKLTDNKLRGVWLEHVKNKLKTNLAELRPTSDDVDIVFKRLRDSAAGPDGISSSLYAPLKNLAPAIFLRVVNGMLDGQTTFDEAFNHAFLCCIPKSSDEQDDTGTPVYTAGSTRPISIVDAANRIIAAILCVALERNVGSRISDMQKGFLHGRKMMSNLIDLDEAAQKISIRTSRGAIILLDFRAAFPSMDHDFIWDTLEAVGLPLEFICAIKMLYQGNKHFLRLQGALFEGPTVYSGVRQGCPLSGLLFAICADVLLIRLEKVLTGSDEVARAFADDTAVAVQDYTKTIATLSNLFQEYASISCLELNIQKTVFIPLWPLSSVRGLRNLITELCPAWRNIHIDVKGKYLGFIIGPGSAELSWSAPLKKFNQRVLKWENKCGLLWSSMYYNTFAVTTLEFVAQLVDTPDEVLISEEAALRRFAPGPGNWIKREDLENLNRFGIGAGFRTISLTSSAAKLRLMRDIGPKAILNRAESLRLAQVDSFSRPFGKWHQCAYVETLCTNWNMFKRQGISIDASIANFQSVSRLMIAQKLAPFDLEERIRSKVMRWHFKDAPRHVAARLVKNFETLSGKVPPAVISTYLRALWNGIPTSRRMATLRDFQMVPCVFKCSITAADSLEHYCRCPKLKEAFAPLTNSRSDNLEDFFGTAKGLTDTERLECARRVRVTCRAIQLARAAEYDSISEVVNLEWNRTFFRRTAREGENRSAAAAATCEVRCPGLSAPG